MTTENESWERQTINKMLELGIKEQRAKRLWGVFFKLFFVVYLLCITFYILKDQDLSASVSGKSVTAVVNLNGEVAAGRSASSEEIIPLLRKAFENDSSKGVILRINSPGGSPVQAKQIYAEMLRLRAKYPEKKLYALIEDLGASAAYLISCGADQIYSDEASIVGSIGVIMESFGLVDTMKKIGAERRLFYAGSNKAMLDPFSPQKPEHKVIIQNEIDLMDKLFVDLVKVSRGKRLKINNETFSGRFWLGIEAKELGLIDGIGDVYTVAKDVIGAEELVEYEPKHSLLSQLSNKFGHSLRSFFEGFRIS